MLPYCTYTPSENLHQFKSSDSRDKYLVTNSYVLIQISRDDQFGVEQYLNFYIRPMNGNRYAIILYIPELVVMESLLERKMDMVTFMNFSSVKDLFHVSSIKDKKSNTPFIAKIKDFIEQSEEKDLWVIENIIDAPFSKKVFIENSVDYKILDNGLLEIQQAGNVFLEAITEFYKNLQNISWVKTYNTKLLLKAITSFESNESFPHFINKISNLKSNELKDSLLKHNIVFYSESENIYPIGYELLPEDYDIGGSYFIKLDVFIDSPTVKDYFMYIQLDKVDDISSFKPSIYMGEINSCISDLLNNVDDVKFAKFDVSVLKLMPTTSKIWFFTNPYHEGLSLYRFIGSDDTTDDASLVDDIFVKRDGDYLTFRYLVGFTVSTSNLWGNMDTILSLTQCGFLVMLEVLGYIPYYKKKVYAKAFSHLVDGATFLHNPVKKIKNWLS